MSIATPFLIEVTPFNVFGVRVRTKNQDEFNSKTARLPKLWQNFSHHLTNLESFSKEEHLIYGVYHDYDSDSSGNYTVTAGVANENSCTQFDKIIIKAGNYLVFKAIGQAPEAIVEAWRAVWDYFDADSKWQRAYLTDYEVYYSNGECAVHVGIL